MEEGSFGRRQQSSAALDLRRAPITLAKQRAVRGAACGKADAPNARAVREGGRARGH